MAERIVWQYFVIRRHVDDMGKVDFYRGDSKEPVCATNADECQVLNTFGEHGYELCSVQFLRTGDMKYFFKRPVSK